MRTRGLLLLVLLLPLSGCPFGAALPPSRTEVGQAFTTVNGGALAPNFHLKTGAHMAGASLNPRFPVDVGAGYLLESVQRDGPPGRGWVHGAYLEATLPLREIGPRSRGFWGGRAELLWDSAGPATQTRLGAGVAARIGVEWFTLGEGTSPFHSRCAAGVVYHRGATALGFFAEGGYQWLPEGRGAMIATAGISVRLPFMAMIGIGIPYCK